MSDPTRRRWPPQIPSWLGGGGAKGVEGTSELKVAFYNTHMDDPWVKFALKIPGIQFFVLFYHSPASFEENKAILETFPVIAVLYLGILYSMALTFTHEEVSAANVRFGYKGISGLGNETSCQQWWRLHILGGPDHPIGDIFIKNNHSALTCLASSVLLDLLIYINLTFAKACYEQTKLLASAYELETTDFMDLPEHLTFQLSDARNEAEDGDGYTSRRRKQGREDALLRYMENRWYRYARWAIVMMVAMTLIGVIISFITVWLALVMKYPDFVLQDPPMERVWSLYSFIYNLNLALLCGVIFFVLILSAGQRDLLEPLWKVQGIVEQKDLARVRARERYARAGVPIFGGMAAGRPAAAAAAVGAHNKQQEPTSPRGFPRQ